jgi:hypothetical protein
LPAILIVSSDRPRMYQSPSSSLSAQSPCTQTLGKRDQYVSSYRRSSRQKPARHADPWRAHDQFTDLIANGSALIVHNVRGNARRRTRKGRRLQRREHVAADKAAGHFRSPE